MERRISPKEIKKYGKNIYEAPSRHYRPPPNQIYANPRRADTRSLENINRADPVSKYEHKLRQDIMKKQLSQNVDTEIRKYTKKYYQPSEERQLIRIKSRPSNPLLAPPPLGATHYFISHPSGEIIYCDSRGHIINAVNTMRSASTIPFNYYQTHQADPQIAKIPLNQPQISTNSSNLHTVQQRNGAPAQPFANPLKPISDNGTAPQSTANPNQQSK